MNNLSETIQNVSIIARLYQEGNLLTAVISFCCCICLIVGIIMWDKYFNNSSWFHKTDDENSNNKPK
jgi:hypothetical protein